MDINGYKQAVEQSDHGSPFLLTNENNTNSMSPLSLIAMVNTYQSDGYLIYLWPYQGWIKSILDEYASTPKAVTCAHQTVENDKPMKILSYYDFLEEEMPPKKNSRCNSAPTTVASPVAFLLSTIVVVAATL